MPSFQPSLGSRMSVLISAGCTLLFLVWFCPAPGFSISNQTTEPRLTLAVLDFGDSNTGRLAADILASNLKNETSISLLDRDQVRAAARGAGYAGAINLSLNEARNLGAALG